MLQVVLVLLVTAAMSVAVLGTVVGEMLPTAAEAGPGAQRCTPRTPGCRRALALVRAARTTVAGAGEVGDLTRLPVPDGAGPAARHQPAKRCPTTARPRRTRSSSGTTSRTRPGARSPGALRARSRASRAAASRRRRTTRSLQSVAVASSDEVLPAGWTDRSVEVVYAFNRSDAGIAGGLVRTGTYSVSEDLCWASPSAEPAGRRVPVLAACDAARAEQQWSFRDDYSIVLAGTQSAVSGAYDGMCLTGEPRGRADLTDHGTAPADATASSSTAVTPDLAGPVDGSAQAFSGASSWLRTPTSFAAPAEVTVAAWFRTTAHGGTVIGFGGDPGTAGTTADRMLWVDSAGHLVWGVSPTSRRTVTSTGTYADGSLAPRRGVRRLGRDEALRRRRARRARTRRGRRPARRRATGTSAGAASSPPGWVQAPSNPYWQGSLAHVSVWPRQLWDWEVTSVATASSWQGGGGPRGEHRGLEPLAAGRRLGRPRPVPRGVRRRARTRSGRTTTAAGSSSSGSTRRRCPGKCLDAPTLAVGAALTLRAGCAAARSTGTRARPSAPARPVT